VGVLTPSPSLSLSRVCVCVCALSRPLSRLMEKGRRVVPEIVQCAESCTIQRHGESKGQPEACRLKEGGRRGGVSAGRLGQELETGAQTARDGGERENAGVSRGRRDRGGGSTDRSEPPFWGPQVLLHCVLIPLWMCPHITILILLYMCPHTNMYVSSNSSVFVLILLCVLIPLYTTIHVSSCYYMCPHATICVHIRLYMSSYYYMYPHRVLIDPNRHLSGGRRYSVYLLYWYRSTNTDPFLGAAGGVQK
jgi:hypothetical protein